MDLFDDLYGTVTTNARAVSKFKPKGKLRPKKQDPLTVPSDTKEKINEHSTTTSDPPNGASLASFGLNGTLTRCEELVSNDSKSEKSLSDDVIRHEAGAKSTTKTQNEVAFSVIDSYRYVGGHTSSITPSVIPDVVKEKPVLETKAPTQLSDVGKSKTEVDTLQSVADTFDDIFSESVTTNAQAGHRFRPKMKPQPRKVATKEVSDTNRSHIAMDSVQSLQSNIVGHTLADYPYPSLHVVNPSFNVSVSEEESGAKDTPKSDFAVPDGSEVLVENVDLLSGLDYLEDIVPQTAASTGSEGPKSPSNVDIDVKHQEKKLMLFGDENDLRDATPEMGTGTVGDNNAQAHCTFESSDFTICDVGPPQPACDYNTINENQDDNGSSEIKGRRAVKFMPKPKRGKGKSKLDASSLPSEEANNSENAVLGVNQSSEGNRNDISTKSNGVRNSEEVENGKSSRQQRKRSKQIVDEDDDVNDPTYEQENNNEEFILNNTKSRKRKAPRKGKELAAGNDEPVQKCKYTKKASQESKSTEEPPKKFSHSSRRNKRRVDKALLEIPEDEIDPQRLPIRDLIILAEHRERMMIKDAAKLKIPQTDQSGVNPFDEGTSRNEEMLSEQGQNSDEEPASPKLQAATTYFNYHTYMRKTPSTRWSKQETQLFYEAVRQFGTDFSLIQQLFPNRTRHQVKLKFKKEERQHPVALSEASINRSKDHSHFESVIERLQQQAAAQKLESQENDPITREEELGNTVDHQNDGPHEKVDKGVKEQEAEEVDVHKSPVKSDESDDDLERWNNY